MLTNYRIIRNNFVNNCASSGQRYMTKNTHARSSTCVTLLLAVPWPELLWCQWIGFVNCSGSMERTCLILTAVDWCIMPPSAITACVRSRCFKSWFVAAVLYRLKCMEKWRKIHQMKAKLLSTIKRTMYIQHWLEPYFLMTEAHHLDIESFIDLSHQSSMTFRATATYSCKITKFSKDCCWGGIDEIWCH
jgi:hypothetical protein